MRLNVHDNTPLSIGYVDHPRGRELAEIDRLISCMPELVKLVHADLVRGCRNPGLGRLGMTAEQVLRVLVLKQMEGFSYDELVFHLADSTCYRTFCRIGVFGKVPQKSTLNSNIKRLRPETLEQIHRVIIRYAAEQGIEKGRIVRADCTVVESNIHDPSDSSLLFDAVRVLTRLLQRAASEFGAARVNHARRAKRRALGILNAKTASAREALYRDLLKVTRKTIGYATRCVEFLRELARQRPTWLDEANGLADEIEAILLLAEGIVYQTERRVLHGEVVPAGEKIVSLFEPHTDIIIKDRRETHYGHKVCLSSGRSNLILDCSIEAGNPADSTLAVKVVERQTDLFERPPRQVTFDGGFASRANVEDIKELGVKDVAFSKKRGLDILEMVKSSWVYRKLRNFRAGIEGVISFLKRCFGLDRVLWKSFESFKAYVWSSVISANLLILARHKLPAPASG